MTNAEARFNKIHIRKVYACLAVTCHLHFWQNDRDFLRATVVTRGWNGYRNKSQHRKSTLEKKILPPFQQGFEPATFQSRVRCSNHWAIPAPSGTLLNLGYLYHHANFERACLANTFSLCGIWKQSFKELITSKTTQPIMSWCLVWDVVNTHKQLYKAWNSFDIW